MSDPFFGLFLVISEVGSPDYTAKSFQNFCVLGDFHALNQFHSVVHLSDFIFANLSSEEN